MPTASSGQVKVDQANYRLYRSSDTAAPGAPLAADNTMATLSQAGASFRVRVGVENKEKFMSANQISAGGLHTCAIAPDNNVYCWGNGYFGILGNNSTADSSVPVAVSTTGVLAGKTIKQISAGGSYTCAIASDDKAYCWGNGSGGVLGNGSTTDSSVPVAVSTTGVLAGKTIKQISVGNFHTCAIASDDKAYCWGYNSFRQLGNNSTADSSVPVAVSTTGVLAGKTIKQISAGGSHTCAIASDNKAYCWGGRYRR